MFETKKEIQPAEGLPVPATAPTAGADATVLQESQTSTDTPVEQALPAGGISPTAGLSDAHASAYDGFDPAIHRTDAAGNPIMTPKGRYAKKPRNGSPDKMSAPSPGISVTVQSSAKPAIDNLPFAKQVCNIAVNGAVRVFGPEWAPTDKAEADGLSFAFRDYFDARGIPKMPPEVVLLLAVVAYSLPRLNHENTKSKLAGIFGKVKDWRSMFGRKS